MTTRVRPTYQDYVALPDDGRRYELHEGELSVTPAPGVSHQDTLGNLYVILRGHVETRSLGKVLFAPVDCILENITIVQPDLVFVESARLTLLSERGLEGTPTLAVEVTSPSSTLIDRRRKLRLYARYAVPCYWIVDPPARTIEAYQLDREAYREVGRLSGPGTVSLPPFSDLTLDPQNIWPR